MVAFAVHKDINYDTHSRLDVLIKIAGVVNETTSFVTHTTYHNMVTDAFLRTHLHGPLTEEGTNAILSPEDARRGWHWEEFKKQTLSDVEDEMGRYRTLFDAAIRERDVNRAFQVWANALQQSYISICGAKPKHQCRGIAAIETNRLHAFPSVHCGKLWLREGTGKVHGREVQRLVDVANRTKQIYNMIKKMPVGGLYVIDGYQHQPEYRTLIATLISLKGQLKSEDPEEKELLSFLEDHDVLEGPKQHLTYLENGRKGL